MSLPERERSYEYAVNVAYVSTGSGYTDRRKLIYGFQGGMRAWTNNPYTMVGSCDASTYGYPGPDWSDYNDVIAGSSFSWMILENPVFGWQLLISMMSNNYYWYLGFSPAAGFTGGNTTTRPTATDEKNLADVYAFWSGSQAEDVRMNLIHAIDGSFDILLPIKCDVGSCQQVLCMAKFEDTPSGWTYPWLATSDHATTAVWPDIDNVDHGWQEATRWFGQVDASQSIEANLCAEVVSSLRVSQAYTAPNDISGRHQMFPNDVVSITSGAYGIHGRLPDVYAVPGDLVTGDSIEEDATNPGFTWMVFGNYAFPWNGSALVTTP